jgi:hypothetical protein
LEALCEPWMPRKEKANMKCPLCERAAAVDLCEYHQAARENLQRAYPMWIKAYGEIEWKDFLDNVKRNVQTGPWAKAVARFLEDR